MVPHGAVAAAGAHTCMVTKSVGRTVTHGAGLVAVSDRESEPHAHHEFEERPRHVQHQCFGGRGMRPCTGTWFLQKLKMGSESFTTSSGGSQRSSHSFVQCRRQRALSEVRGHRDH